MNNDNIVAVFVNQYIYTNMKVERTLKKWK
jgi:hypothetical protein